MFIRVRRMLDACRPLFMEIIKPTGLGCIHGGHTDLVTPQIYVLYSMVVVADCCHGAAAAAVHCTLYAVYSISVHRGTISIKRKWRPIDLARPSISPSARQPARQTVMASAVRHRLLGSLGETSKRNLSDYQYATHNDADASWWWQMCDVLSWDRSLCSVEACLLHGTMSPCVIVCVCSCVCVCCGGFGLCCFGFVLSLGLEVCF